MNANDSRTNETNFNILGNPKAILPIGYGGQTFNPISMAMNTGSMMPAPNNFMMSQESIL